MGDTWVDTNTIDSSIAILLLANFSKNKNPLDQKVALAVKMHYIWNRGKSENVNARDGIKKWGNRLEWVVVIYLVDPVS